MPEFDLNKFKKCLLVVVFIALVVGLIVGIYYNLVTSLVENLLAGLVITLFGIYLVTFLVTRWVDEVNNKLRERQWTNVRKSIYETIINDLFMIAFYIYIKLPIAGLTHSYSYDPSETRKLELNREIWTNLPSEFDSFLDLLQKLIKSREHEITIEEGSGKGLVLEDRHVIDRNIKETYEDLRPILDGIRYIKIQRVIQSSTDQEIINALIHFETIIDMYYYNIRLFYSKGANIMDSMFVAKSMKKLIEESFQLCPQLKATIRDPISQG